MKVSVTGICSWSVLVFGLSSLIFLTTAQAQGPGQGFRGGKGPGGPPPGRGMGRGMGIGRQADSEGKHGPRQDDRFAADHDVFEFLLSHHDQIVRTVKELDNGVETLTESKNQEIADKLKEHVEWMKVRVEDVKPIRMRDPLFAELFRNADKILMEYEETENGVKVTETSEDPFVVQLIQEHAKVVSKFVERGHDEAMKNHSVPGRLGTAKSDVLVLKYPVIEGHGGVVRLADAAHQPRAGTKLIIDITKGSEPNALNASLEKVAKYLNIYAGGGDEPANAEIALIFHGDATLAVLNPDKYKESFGTENPNLELLRQFHEAGVELYVCGQTLISKGARPQDVAVFVETAVSALTVVVNLQSDGYSYVPLLK